MEIDEIETYEDMVILFNNIHGSDGILQFLRENGLLKKRGPRCCNRMMKECPYGRNRRFGKTWRCSLCRKTRLPLVGSFFERSRLNPLVILKVAYSYLVLKLNYKAIRACVKNAPAHQNLTDWLQFCRDVLSHDLLRDKDKLGGVGKVVVVDQTAFARRERRKGSQDVHETIWILGIYDVEEKKGVLVYIEDRSHEAIIPKVQDHVEQGSTIYTDELRTYACLANRGYDHKTVNRSHEPAANDGTPISHMKAKNHIKGYFSHLKKYLRKRNVGLPESLPGYLDEFMWMERHQEDTWGSFLRAVRRQYRC
ncbi:hypothetical protein FJT64_017578 [Amphibalanus amphitrite]|uniref:ISXO2-like transposase domain-containing protein n=1 Tax=Amphibalanus amphitrite TaxID=1232801 RepID=A0A6A4X6J8_AMPAM|nr:hypothetical protein FJT64_017578 [Amphibalanus amphitrite]